jgi:hypothetical protein
MSKVIDLTDFRVTESDNGETYVVLKKDFETLREAMHFEREILKAVDEQAENGVFKRCLILNHPFAYLPLIKVKAEDFWEAYDEQGDLIDEEPDVIEQMVGIVETTVLARPLKRSPSDPGSLQITITMGIPMELFERTSKEEIKITCVE